MKRIYIAGPMRGIPLCNFPAFDAAAKKFRSEGWAVISPADMDRARGFDGTGYADNAFLKQAIIADLIEISECDAIALLPGWRQSMGVAVELALAKFLHLQVIDTEITYEGLL